MPSPYHLLGSCESTLTKRWPTLIDAGWTLLDASRRGIGAVSRRPPDADRRGRRNSGDIPGE
eukprot:8829399-Pyramimonas_sp.AAC.1